MSFIAVPPGSPAPALQPLYELESPAVSPPRRRQIQNALYRGRWLLVAVAAAGVLAGAAASWVVRPYYEADGSVIIAHPSLHDAEITPQEYPPPVDADREMQTELTILGSRAVAGPVITSLDLEGRDPEIRASLAAAERAARARGTGLSAARRGDIAYGVFSTKLKLVPDKLSSTVHVEYGSQDPHLAAAVVNATTAEFLRYTLAERGAQGETTAHWMQQQVAAAVAELSTDDQAVADFQRQHAYTPLLEGDGAQSGLLDRLSDANHAWSAAQAERIADEAQVRSYAGGTALLPADLRDPAIDRASDNVGAAEQQLTALESTYRPDFPLVVEARTQLAGAQQQLAALRRQISTGLEQQLASSQQREAELGGLVRSLSQAAAATSGLQVRFGVLQSQAEAQRELVNTLREKLAEVEMEATLPPDNLQQLDPAVAPASPAYPRLPLDLELGLGVGLVLGVGTALAREGWNESLMASDAVKRGLGPALAPLGMIAEQTPVNRRRALPPANTGFDGHAVYAKVAANLVARCGAPPRAILVTSANPGEGKTTSVCQLGLALAAGGWRTLIVDGDVRRPGCHDFFGLPNATGVLAAQAGRKVAPLAVAPHLDLMPCESGGQQPLQTRAVAGLLEQWREHYDYVLIDSPPGNLTGEAVLVSSLVEGVLVVLRWGRTRLPEAQQLCEELARARAPLLGTLFNRADPGAPAYRGYRPAAAQ